MENNFKCPSCGKEHYIVNFKIAYSGKVVYKHKNGVEIKCDDCDNVVLTSIKRKDDFNFEIGKFSSMSKEQKSKHLKERSRTHNQSPEMKQYREWMLHRTSGKKK